MLFAIRRRQFRRLSSNQLDLNFPRVSCVRAWQLSTRVSDCISFETGSERSLSKGLSVNLYCTVTAGVIPRTPLPPPLSLPQQFVHRFVDFQPLRFISFHPFRIRNVSMLVRLSLSHVSRRELSCERNEKKEEKDKKRNSKKKRRKNRPNSGAQIHTSGSD